jgi:hypothetical protein
MSDVPHIERRLNRRPFEALRFYGGGHDDAYSLY